MPRVSVEIPDGFDCVVHLEPKPPNPVAPRPPLTNPTPPPKPLLPRRQTILLPISSLRPAQNPARISANKQGFKPKPKTPPRVNIKDGPRLQALRRVRDLKQTRVKAKANPKVPRGSADVSKTRDDTLKTRRRHVEGDVIRKKSQRSTVNGQR